MIRLSAFADEISPDLNEQVEVSKTRVWFYSVLLIFIVCCRVPILQE
jgi:hypothetical protein